MKNTKDRDKYLNDPQVPVRGDRFNAALDFHGLTVSALARRIDEAQQTLDYIARGKTKKCRLSRRDRIARALRVPPRWLGGQLRTLDTWNRFDDDDPRALSSRAQLAEARLKDLVVRAWRRDVQAAEPILQPSSREYRDMRYWLEKTISTWLNPWKWQRRLLVQPAEAECSVTEEMWEVLVEGLATALEATLEPWLSGNAQLDYGALRDMVGLAEGPLKLCILPRKRAAGDRETSPRTLRPRQATEQEIEIWRSEDIGLPK